MSEIALWRAVVMQAVADSRLNPPPLPTLPPQRTSEERSAFRMLPVEQRRAITLERRNARNTHTKILREHLAKAEAIGWLRDAGLDFKLVCGWADVEPEYVQRKAKESNGLGVGLQA